MRAVVMNQSDRPVGGAEADQVLAEESHPQWRPVWLGHFIRAHRWQPVLTHELAHRRARPNATQILVFDSTQHATRVLWSRCSGAGALRPPGPVVAPLARSLR